MSAMRSHRLNRLPEVFGDVLSCLRRARNQDADALANASDLSTRMIRGMEAGSYGPNLEDLLCLAIGLEESPVILLAEVISALRTDSADLGSTSSGHQTWPGFTDLGISTILGASRELDQTYSSLDLAAGGARKANAKHVGKGEPPVDVVTIYIRVGHVQVDVRPEAEAHREEAQFTDGLGAGI